MEKKFIIKEHIKFLESFIERFECDIDYIMYNVLSDEIDRLKKML